MALDVRKMSKNGESYSYCEVNGFGRGHDDEDDEQEESKPLLPPEEGGGGAGVGVANRQRTVRRKVQWNDDKGNKLVEVREFEPSEASDSEDDDFFDSCICSVM